MIKLLDILNESYNPNIYRIECRLVVTAGNRPMQEIISDIRAVPGVTIVDITNSDYNTEEGRHIVDLSIKVDPSPFNPFGKSSFDKILNDIKKLPDVRGAKFISNPILAESKLQKLVKEVLQEEDRCKRIADRKYDKPSTYKTGAIVRCRKGNIWKGLKETDDPQSGKAAPYGSGYAKVKEAIQKILKEDESLYKWFKRSGAKGKEGGWVDCNAPDGKGGYKTCGRKEGEKRAKYPSCRPTAAKCKSPGKGKKWGKTK